MKTRRIESPPATRTSFRFIASALLLAAALTGQAGLSEPDNLLYGTIAFQGETVTAEYLDVVVEARRAPDGPAVASYRMGDRPGVGNLYYLRVPMESGSPRSNPNASLAGETLYISVVDSTGLRDQQAYVLSDRGAVQRLDFGAINPDSDSNGLPDAWEQAAFGAIGQDPNAVQWNGLTTWENYVAGTMTNQLFCVQISRNSGQQVVSFQTIAAAGVGYEGLTRVYSLESAEGLGSTWLGVPAHTRILGTGQPVIYTEQGTNSASFYRVQVRLEAQ